MEKLILIVLGLGLFILAMGDESGGDAEAGAAVPGTPASAVMTVPMGGMRPAYATGAPSPEREPLTPVNPIPPASALHGKVIDDRYQPDG
ncbi:MAG: hypothetical protein WBL20_23055 [Sphingobium sp.]|uniref:hypothetical protein n=1 Tax=Sphingobium sp. TaxID=1912891 RepID=UPI002E200B17